MKPTLQNLYRKRKGWRVNHIKIASLSQFKSWAKGVPDICANMTVASGYRSALGSEYELAVECPSLRNSTVLGVVLLDDCSETLAVAGERSTALFLEDSDRICFGIFISTVLCRDGLIGF